MKRKVDELFYISFFSFLSVLYASNPGNLSSGTMSIVSVPNGEQEKKVYERHTVVITFPDDSNDFEDPIIKQVGKKVDITLSGNVPVGSKDLEVHVKKQLVEVAKLRLNPVVDENFVVPEYVAPLMSATPDAAEVKQENKDGSVTPVVTTEKKESTTQSANTTEKEAVLAEGDKTEPAPKESPSKDKKDVDTGATQKLPESTGDKTESAPKEFPSKDKKDVDTSATQKLPESTGDSKTVSASGQLKQTAVEGASPVVNDKQSVTGESNVSGQQSQTNLSTKTEDSSKNAENKNVPPVVAENVKQGQLSGNSAKSVLENRESGNSSGKSNAANVNKIEVKVQSPNEGNGSSNEGNQESKEECILM